MGDPLSRSLRLQPGCPAALTVSHRVPPNGYFEPEVSQIDRHPTERHARFGSPSYLPLEDLSERDRPLKSVRQVPSIHANDALPATERVEALVCETAAAAEARSA